MRRRLGCRSPGLPATEEGHQWQELDDHIATLLWDGSSTARAGPSQEVACINANATRRVKEIRRSSRQSSRAGSRRPASATLRPSRPTAPPPPRRPASAGGRGFRPAGPIVPTFQDADAFCRDHNLLDTMARFQEEHQEMALYRRALEKQLGQCHRIEAQRSRQRPQSASETPVMRALPDIAPPPPEMEVPAPPPCEPTRLDTTAPEPMPTETSRGQHDASKGPEVFDQLNATIPVSIRTRMLARMLDLKSEEQEKQETRIVDEVAQEADQEMEPQDLEQLNAALGCTQAQTIGDECQTIDVHERLEETERKFLQANEAARAAMHIARDREEMLKETLAELKEAKRWPLAATQEDDRVDAWRHYEERLDSISAELHETKRQREDAVAESGRTQELLGDVQEPCSLQGTLTDMMQTHCKVKKLQKLQEALAEWEEARLQRDNLAEDLQDAERRCDEHTAAADNAKRQLDQYTLDLSEGKRQRDEAATQLSVAEVERQELQELNRKLSLAKQTLEQVGGLQGIAAGQQADELVSVQEALEAAEVQMATAQQVLQDMERSYAESLERRRVLEAYLRDILAEAEAAKNESERLAQQLAGIDERCSESLHAVGQCENRLAAFLAELGDWKSQIASLQSAHQEMKEALSGKQRSLEEANNRIKQLYVKNKRLREVSQSAISEMNPEDATSRELRRGLEDATIRCLRRNLVDEMRKCSDLDDTLRRLRSELEDAKASHSAALASASEETSIASLRIAELEAELQSQGKVSQDAARRIVDLEHKVQEQHTVAEDAKAGWKATTIVVEELEAQLEKQQQTQQIALEHANKKVADLESNLREQQKAAADTAKAVASSDKQSLARFAELQAQLEQTSIASARVQAKLESASEDACVASARVGELEKQLQQQQTMSEVSAKTVADLELRLAKQQVAADEQALGRVAELEKQLEEASVASVRVAALEKELQRQQDVSAKTLADLEARLEKQQQIGSEEETLARVAELEKQLEEAYPMSGWSSARVAALQKELQEQQTMSEGLSRTVADLKNKLEKQQIAADKQAQLEKTSTASARVQAQLESASEHAHVAAASVAALQKELQQQQTMSEVSAKIVADLEDILDKHGIAADEQISTHVAELEKKLEEAL